MEENFHRDYFECYFQALFPSFLRRQSDVDALKALLEKHQGSDKTLLIKLLMEAIDEVEELILIYPN